MCKTEDNFSPVRSGCLFPFYWHSYDKHSTEKEVTEGIYGLVRMLQPDYCVETGSYQGFTSESIGRALVTNAHGRLDTIEIDSDLAETTKVRCVGLPVTVHPVDSMSFMPDNDIDFAFFDSSADKGFRKREFKRYYQKMHARTVVCFHDTFVNGPSASAILMDVVDLAEEGLLAPCFIPTPRGLAICRVRK